MDAPDAADATDARSVGDPIDERDAAERAELEVKRATAAVERVPGTEPAMHAVYRYRDAVRVLRDDDRFVAMVDPNIPASARVQWAADPGEHQHRRASVFFAGRLAALAPQIAARSATLLDALPAPRSEPGPVELGAAYARPLATGALADVLGIAVGWRERVFAAADAMAGDPSAIHPQPSWDAGHAEIAAFVAEHRPTWDAESTGAAPGAGVGPDRVGPSGLALLARPDPRSGRVVPDEELVAFTYLLCRSGSGPTVRLVATIAQALAVDPAARAALAAEPAAAPAYVERRLEALPAIRYLLRVSTAEGEIGAGTARVRVAEGDHVVMNLTSTNHDDAKAGADGSGDPERPRHLAFGRGQHFCPAAGLGRLVAAQAAVDLSTRLPDLRLAPGADTSGLRIPKVWTPFRLDVLL